MSTTIATLAGARPRLFACGERAVLVERGEGLTELGDPPVTHALSVAHAERGASPDELVLVDTAGTIHRYTPGQPPQPRWRSGTDPRRLTVTALSDDRLAIATYGRLLRCVELRRADRRLWRRRGSPKFLPAGPSSILTTWTRRDLLDGDDAVSMLDLDSGRDRWRLPVARLVAALTAHPAHAEAQRLQIRLPGASPRRPSWPPQPLAVVDELAWFTLVGGDLGSYLFALDLARGELSAAVALRAVVPEGLARGGEYHLLTVGRYEVFDLRRGGARLLDVSLRDLPTLVCRILALPGERRALLGSRWGHLIVADLARPERPHVLFHREDHLLGDLAVTAGRLRFLLHPAGGRDAPSLLATRPWDPLEAFE